MLPFEHQEALESGSSSHITTLPASTSSSCQGFFCKLQKALNGIGQCSSQNHKGWKSPYLPITTTNHVTHDFQRTVNSERKCSALSVWWPWNRYHPIPARSYLQWACSAVPDWTSPRQEPWHGPSHFLCADFTRCVVKIPIPKAWTQPVLCQQSLSQCWQVTLEQMLSTHHFLGEALRSLTTLCFEEKPLCP